MPNNRFVNKNQTIEPTGYGGLSLSVEGPSKAEIKCQDNENGTLDVSYRPTEPGYYIMNLKFADHHVTGSPFTIKVTGEGSNTQTERIKRDRDAVPQTEVGSKCRLAFKIPGVSAYDLAASLRLWPEWARPWRISSARCWKAVAASQPGKVL